MTRFALAAGLVALAAAPGPLRGQDDKPVPPELEGAWVLTGLEAGGVKLGPEDLKKVGPEDLRTFTFKAAAVTYRAGPKTVTAPVKVDTTTTPPTLDVLAKDEPLYAVYRVEGDTLTICAARKAGERPADLKASKTAVLMTLTKKK